MHALVSNLLINIVHVWARQPAPAKFQLLADIEIPSAISCRMRCNTLSHSCDVGCNLVSPTLLRIVKGIYPHQIGQLRLPQLAHNIQAWHLKSSLQCSLQKALVNIR